MKARRSASENAVRRALSGQVPNCCGLVVAECSTAGEQLLALVASKVDADLLVGYNYLYRKSTS